MSRPPPTSTRTVPLFPTTPLFRPPIWGPVMPVAETNKPAASDEILIRQVHPKMMQQEGRLWSGAFTPTKADNGLLSADRDSVISPKEAYERYLKLKQLTQGGGSWGVSIGEFKELDLICYSEDRKSTRLNSSH